MDHIACLLAFIEDQAKELGMLWRQTTRSEANLSTNVIIPTGINNK
jgi:hypothetical protein